MVQMVFLRKSEDGKKWAGRLSPEKRAGYLESLRRRVHIVWVTDPDVESPGRAAAGTNPRCSSSPRVSRIHTRSGWRCVRMRLNARAASSMAGSSQG